MVELHLDLTDDLMVPVSEINEARRTALSRIEVKRAAVFGHEPVLDDVFSRRYAAAINSGPAKAARIKKKPVLSVTVTDLPSLKAAVESGAGMIYFGGEQFRSKEALLEAQI